MPNLHARKIRRIRHALDLQRAHFVDALDMSLRAYTDHENGRSAFKIEHLEKLSGFFNITTGQLLDLSEDELIILILKTREKNL